MLVGMSIDHSNHWQVVHTTKAVDDVSWWQRPDDLWLDLIEDLGLAPGALVADVGCGSSLLVDALLATGRHRVVGVDLAQAALDRVRERLGARDDLTLVRADARHLRLPEPAAVWHDRAVFHFLTTEPDRAAYSRSLAASLAPDGHAIVATFATDGPESCSGLPVQRYDAEGLAAALALPGAEVVRAERRVHDTPWGTQQPFTIVVLRRRTI
jgi:SAM-dependent methyltransferase